MMLRLLAILALFVSVPAFATESTTPASEPAKSEEPVKKPHPLFNPAGDLRRLQGGAVKSAPEIAEEEDENIGPEDLLEQPKLADTQETPETTLTADDEAVELGSDEDDLFYDFLND